MNTKFSSLNIIDDCHVEIDGILYVNLPSCDACDVVNFNICEKLNCQTIKNKSCIEYVWRKSALQKKI